MTNYKRSISKLMRTISKADYKIRQAIEEGSDFASIMADHSYKSRLIFGILRHLQNKGPLPCYEDFIAAYCKGEKRLCDAPAYLRHKQACEFISSMPFGREYLEGLPERRLRSIIAKVKKLSVQKRLEYVKKLIPKADNSKNAVMDNCRKVVPYNVKAMADNFHTNSLEKTQTIQAMPLLLCVSDKTDVPSELNADNLPDNSKYIPKPHNYDFVLGNRKNIGWDENGDLIFI